MASTPVSTVAFLRSDGGAGWDEYEGVLHGASSEIRLLRHGSLVRSFALSKGAHDASCPPRPPHLAQAQT